MWTVFEYSEEDLKSNLRGFITPGQKAWIENMAMGIRKSQSGSLKAGAFFVIFGLCMITVMFLSAESYREMLLTNPMGFLPILAVIPIVGFIFALSMYFANRRAERLSNSELKRAEGTVRLDESHTSKAGTTYHVFVGDTEFQFAEDVSSVFKEDARFLVFYCETTMLKLILSLEKIGQA